MDIGTVIVIEIEGEDKTCVLINKKYYSDFLLKKETTPAVFLTRYNDGNINEVVTIPFFIIREEKAAINEVMCYEFMYGDKRVWVIGETKLASMVKVQVQQG